MTVYTVVAGTTKQLTKHYCIWAQLEVYTHTLDDGGIHTKEDMDEVTRSDCV